MANILSVSLNPAVDVSCEAELVQPTRKTRTYNQSQYPGGGGVNVARVIATLGGTVELLFLSGGATGALLEDCLGSIPVTPHKVPIDEPTRIAYMVHEKQSGFEYRFVPEGPEVRDSELKQAFEFIERFEGDYIVASGSLPRGAPDNTYANMAEIANRKGARFILDSSGEGLRRALSQSSVFLVKPSLGELEKLVGAELDEDNAQEAALELVRSGSAHHVAVTMGAQGAFLANSEGVLRAPSRHVNVRSAVGAGDSFVGAMTFSLAAGDSIEDAFRLGVAAGAAAVMTTGTQLCRRDDVLTLYDAMCDKRNFVSR